MIKVITYGTFDHLHQGHINLLKRAKALGDYLIVGVTTENFDITRGKINVQQSLMERMEAIRNTGLVDEVFPEEYEGQKIDDIKRHNIDIFAIGSDWKGYFDYLNEFCEVIYLPRTSGISSTSIRSQKNIKIGIIGSDPAMLKMKYEACFVNGITMNEAYFDEEFSCKENIKQYSSVDDLIKNNDAVYIVSKPNKRAGYIMKALDNNKHIICDSPLSLSKKETISIINEAKRKNLILFDSIKTAYSLAFCRLILLIKSGIIGEIKSIDSTCTSQEMFEWLKKSQFATSFTTWGAISLLPVLKIFGINYKDIQFNILHSNEVKDIFTKVTITYENAVATINVGTGVKSESDLRIAGTKGYIYIPAPWWKTEYFEARFENSANNKRYFYKLEGEGLRNELVDFVNCIRNRKINYYVEEEISEEISSIMEKYCSILNN